MAAIKRSQANQRRQPDGLISKQEQGKDAQMGASGIRVEIHFLILAILDDPIVSRVFFEAGFSSYEIKLAILRPFQSFWRYNSCNPRQRREQNISLQTPEENLIPGLRPFQFPFSEDSYGGEEFRRIGEVLARRKGRNPLLFGVCACDALHGFIDAMERCRRSEQVRFLPSEIRGMNVFVVEREILRFVNENCGEELIERKVEELGTMMERCSGPGLLVSLGDLKAFVKDDEDDVLSVNLVMKFTKLLEDHRDRCWLIGCATYEIYLKFLNRFPSVEKDWDLQPLAITSMKHPKGEISFKSSLMGSFVPFAGFFPSSSDYRGTLRSSYQLPTHGNFYSEEHAQAVTTRAGYHPVADPCQTALPSWLRMTEISTSNRFDIFKAKDDDAMQGAKEDEEKAHRFVSMVDHRNTESLKPSNKPSKIATDLILGVSLHSHGPAKENSCMGLAGHVDMDNVKSLSEAMIRRIGRQEEALKTISQTISYTRASKGMLKGSRIRGDMWMNLTGADVFGMRKAAVAVAEVVTGSKDNLIHFDLVTDTDARIRRKTMVDHIADSLSKMPLSVVFLENLDYAHPPAQKSLLHAVRSGKFLDSHGREVGISNAIFLLKTRSSCFHEDRILRAKPRPLQITVTITNSFNKRKRTSCLDLNIPPEEGASDYEDHPTNAWLDDLLSQVDTTVVFKPFEYDVVAEKLVGLIHGCFSRSFCSECELEIESRAMDQIIAGACSSEKKGEVEEWLDKVVSRGFVVARKRYHLSSHCVVRLDTCAAMYVEEEEPCGWLPFELVLNCQS